MYFNLFSEGFEMSSSLSYSLLDSNRVDLIELGRLTYYLQKGIIKPTGISLLVPAPKSLGVILGDSSIFGIDVDYDERGRLLEEYIWFVHNSGSRPSRREGKNKVLPLLKPTLDLHRITDQMLRFAQECFEPGNKPEWTIGQLCLKAQHA